MVNGYQGRLSCPICSRANHERVTPAISQKMLIQQLRQMEKHGIVSRTVHHQMSPWVGDQVRGRCDNGGSPIDAGYQGRLGGANTPGSNPESPGVGQSLFGATRVSSLPKVAGYRLAEFVSQCGSELFRCLEGTVEAKSRL